MKTLSIAEFKELIGRKKDWVREQALEIIDTTTINRHASNWPEITGEDPLPEREVEVRYFNGIASKVSSHGDITMTYEEGYGYEEFDPDSFINSTDGLDTVWRIEGVTVLDEDGDEMDAHDLGDLLPGEFSEISYEEVQIEKIIDVNVDEGAEESTYTLTRENAKTRPASGSPASSSRPRQAPRTRN